MVGTVRLGPISNNLNVLAAKFPFETYQALDNISLLDPYVSKYVYTTVALWKHRPHNLEIMASSQSEADRAIDIANNFAARCFPLSGGLDGLINALFSQVARSGGCCVEWVPDPTLSYIDRAYLVPIKSIRWSLNQNRGTGFNATANGSTGRVKSCSNVLSCVDSPWLAVPTLFRPLSQQLSLALTTRLS